MSDEMSDRTVAKPKYVFFRSVLALMLREMSTTYGRSPGGYIWAFAEPIGGILVMTLVFSLIARSPALGTNFPLFFATGMLPFLLYNATANNVSMAIYRFEDHLFLHAFAPTEDDWEKSRNVEVLERWSEYMAKLLETDADGNIIFDTLDLAFSFGEFQSAD